MQTQINKKDLIDLINYMHRAPQKFRAASAMYLNRAAFGSRDNIINYMHTHMTIRNPSFLRSRIRVQKTPLNASYSAQKAEVGSIRTQRHTGWAEQEGLAADKRDKTITLAARLNNKTKRVAPRLRLKRGLAWNEPSQYAGRSRAARANTMLWKLGAGRSRKPFILYGHRRGNLPDGLWRFGAGPKNQRKLILIQAFKRAPAGPKRMPWMRSSVARYMRETNKPAVWADILRRTRATDSRLKRR